MKHLKSLSLGAAVVLAIAVQGSAFAQNNTVAIGYQAPLTGEYAQYGILFRNSATMAVEDFNKSGKLPGVTIVLKFEDSKGDAKEGVNIAKKFVDDKQIVGVIGDFSSTVSMAAAQVYKEAKMPQLSQTASHPDYVKISEWQFRNITTQAYEGPFVANWATSNPKLKKFAVVGIQNDWGQSAVQNFVEGVKAKGGDVVETEFFNPGTRDFRSILTKIARAHPDAVYMAMFYEDGAAFLQQRLQMGLKTPVYATSSLYSPKLIELAGPAANGLFLSSTFVKESDSPNVKAYVKEYKARYKSEPDQFSAQGFDATNIMLDAIVRAGGVSATRQKVRDALAATKNFPGITGNTTFDPVTREPSKTLTHMQIRDGKFVAIQ
ncbi:MAG: ABC transporter substrate-binding protein [Burkholderiales bacterium]